ncbi:MAG: hypothetical protein AMXMBFR84_08970 [Candidatus Hydrogenedentota bacterium]
MAITTGEAASRPLHSNVYNSPMFTAYRFPTHYPPYWHLGARMGVGPVREFLRRRNAHGAVSLLDIGCGPGSNSLLAAECGYRAIAADLSPHSLRLTQKTARQMGHAATVETLMADGLALPFRDASFDVVFASHVIEHLDEPAMLLREIDRVLKPGGMARIACPTPYHGMRLLPRLGFELDPHDHKVTGYSERDIVAMLPSSMRVARATYQGRFFESNGCDLQYLMARSLGVQANPVEDPRNTGTARMPSGPLFFLLREIALLPWLAACKVEDIVLPFMKGSMVSMEIEKAP